MHFAHLLTKVEIAEKIEDEDKFEEDMDKIQLEFDSLWEEIETKSYFVNKNADVDRRIFPRLLALIGTSNRGSHKFWAL